MDRGLRGLPQINGVGGSVGPDLTQVGAWTQLMPVEEWEAFLYEWVRLPAGHGKPGAGVLVQLLRTAAVRRGGRRRRAGGRRHGHAARHRSSARGRPSPAAAFGLRPTQMPPMPMTDEEREALVR